MEIIFESTEEFEQDLKLFSEAEQLMIIQQVHDCAPLLLTDSSTRERRLHQFHSFKLAYNFESTLYSFIVNYYLRVILCFDEDPLLDRTLVTLFRVVERSKAPLVYQQIGESIYQKILISEPFKSPEPVSEPVKRLNPVSEPVQSPNSVEVKTNNGTTPVTP